MTRPGILPSCVPTVSWTPDPLSLSTALWTPQTGPLPPERLWETEVCCSVRNRAGPEPRRVDAGRGRPGSEPKGPHRLRNREAEPKGFCL